MSGLSGVELAQAVLAAKDRYALLSLGSEVRIEVQPDGFLNLEDEQVRRVYTKLAARIHPDKLHGFDQATQAFQALVRAYELCCKPDLRQDESDDSVGEDSSAPKADEAKPKAKKPRQTSKPKTKGKAAQSKRKAKGSNKKPKAASRRTADDAWMVDDDSTEDESSQMEEESSEEESSEEESSEEDPQPKPKPKPRKPRSNVGCFRTGVHCPKCKASWGDHLKSEGNEILYSQFMKGAALVHCLRCLLEFGVLTATHTCPHCSKPYTYFPSQYNKKIFCPNKQCSKKFGILNVEASSGRARQQLQAIEQQRKDRETQSARAEARAARAERNTIESDVDEFTMQLGAFIVSEDCPVCKAIVTDGHKAHLIRCLKKQGVEPKSKSKSRAKKNALSAKPQCKKRAPPETDTEDDEYEASEEEIDHKKNSKKSARKPVVKKSPASKSKATQKASAKQNKKRTAKQDKKPTAKRQRKPVTKRQKKVEYVSDSDGSDVWEGFTINK